MQLQPQKEQVREICPRCGKPAGGSMTAWIFGKTSGGRALCSCPKTDAMEERPPDLVVDSELVNSHTNQALSELPALDQDPDHAASSAELKSGHDLVGQTILGSYLILEKIGSGGMGVVYKAMHLHLKEVVAIKAISRDRSLEEKDVARLRREARAACALSHPNIVAYRDFNIDESGRAFIVMQYVEGETLEERLERESY